MLSGYHKTYYQFFTHALRSLIRIGDQNPLLRKEIAAAFKEVLAKEVPGAPYGKDTDVKYRDGYREYLLTEGISMALENTLAGWNIN